VIPNSQVRLYLLSVPLSHRANYLSRQSHAVRELRQRACHALRHIDYVISGRDRHAVSRSKVSVDETLDICRVRMRIKGRRLRAGRTNLTLADEAMSKIVDDTCSPIVGEVRQSSVSRVDDSSAYLMLAQSRPPSAALESITLDQFVNNSGSWNMALFFR
jgi:hypothetical protein